jgi:hypothetical protein
MSATINIVETTTELGVEVVEVTVTDASAPGPAGPGVPTGGTDGQVLTKASGTDYDTAWEDATGGGAPDDVDYLVGTASGDLSAEIVVGTSPGGELGGTWAAPTVDATHSGSSHAAVQAAAEATAAAALSAHVTDTEDAHDASAISIADAGNDFTATDVEGALAELQADHEADATALSDHIADTSAAHAASAIAFTPDGSIAATTVQAAIVEVRDEAGGGGAPTDVDYLVGTASGGLSAEIVVGTSPGGELGGTWASPTVDATHSGSSHASVQAAAEATAAAALDAHVTDATDAHDASAISVDSTTLSGTGTTVQASLEEIDNLLDDHSARHENGGADEISLAGLDGTPAELTNHLNDTSAAHAASAISADSTTLVGTGTDVQAVLEELDNGIADHLADSSAAHAASAISADSTTLVGTGTDVQAVLEELDNGIADHLADTSDAHDASAISVADSGTFYTATDVEGVLAEIAPQLGGAAGHAADGWVDDTATTWTYASATTFTIAGVDVTAKFSKGTRIKLTQTTVKYFVVVASSFSTNTTVTITGGTDYTLANAAISDNYYSYAANPQGYPEWFNYTPTYTGFSADPSGGVARFAVHGRVCFVDHVRTAGTSNATTFTITLPVTSIGTVYQAGRGTNNSVELSAPCLVVVWQTSATTIDVFRTYQTGGTAWTNSGTKNAQFFVEYPL